jgi:hypothetical protein
MDGLSMVVAVTTFVLLFQGIRLSSPETIRRICGAVAYGFGITSGRAGEPAGRFRYRDPAGERRASACRRGK